MITRGQGHGRIGRAETAYSEDEMHRDPASPEILLAWQTQGRPVRGLGVLEPQPRRVSGILL